MNDGYMIKPFRAMIPLSLLPRAIGALSMGMACSSAYSIVHDLGVPTNISCGTAFELHEQINQFTYDSIAPGTDCLWFTFCIGPEEGTMGVSVYNFDFGWQPIAMLWFPTSCEDLKDCTRNLGVAQWTIPAGGGSWAPGTYYISIPVDELEGVDYFAIGMEGWDPDGCGGEDVQPEDCASCLGTFSPLPGHRYLVNAWVSLGELPPGTLTFSGPAVRIECPEGNTLGTWTPSGPIIDGWQRIEGVFDVPDDDPTSFHVFLEAEGEDDVYFDDVRIVPEKGSMQSYVYDPENLRFVAQLDERHFATIYEYDPEGKLVRVKKETERGIMTLKETRYNSSKLNQP